ncbi:MAG: integral rane protein, partial [Friedmanniella sp.]|nr:integral rane protein [Friedmanniella sp.]
MAWTLVPLTTGPAGHPVLAVVLAAAGAVLFGFAAIRQHGIVDSSARGEGRRSLSRSMVREVVRHPDWLLGAAQGVAAIVLHTVALAFGPISLIQPVGVLAVPVTVAAESVRARRRPTRSAVLGAALSVLGIIALTLVLLAPESAVTVTVPGLRLVLVTVAVTLLLSLAVTALTRRASLPVRCTTLALTAATLFGLTSPLLRVIGHLVASGAAHGHLLLIAANVAGIALAAPLGMWLMQTAYVAGSPQVVICCLTLGDPVVAVAVGRLLLAEGAGLSVVTVVVALGCGLVAAVGVLLLSRSYPHDAVPSPGVELPEPAAPVVAWDGA